MIHPDDVTQHLMLCRTEYSRRELARLLERDEKTIEGYARGRPMPPATRLLVEILGGRMPWRGFEGYEVKQGHFYPPGHRDGVPVTQLPVLHWQLQRLEILDRELKYLKSLPVQYLLEFGPGSH